MISMMCLNPLRIGEGFELDDDIYFLSGSIGLNPLRIGEGFEQKMTVTQAKTNLS